MDTWKPSTGLGAVALALFVTAVVALTAPAHEMAWYGYLFGMVACGTLALIHLGAAGLRGGTHLVFTTWERVLQMAELHQKLQPVEAALPVAETAAAEVEMDGLVMAEWRAAAHRFLVAGDRHGFGVRVLFPLGYVGWDEWGVMHKFLVEAGILEHKPARWAQDWSLERWYEKGHSTPLPYRKEKPPTVALGPTTATPQRPQQPVIIDAEVQKG